MTRLLSLFGLMRVSEHEADCDLCQNARVVRDAIDPRSYPETAPCPKCRDGYWALKAARDWQAKFKKAVTDLEKRDREAEQLSNEIAMQATSIADANRRADQNEIDATLWRNARDARRNARSK